MAPLAKSKAKAKAKGKAKAKAKGKAKAVATKREAITEAGEGAEEQNDATATELAIPAKRSKPLGWLLRDKVLKGLGEQSVEEGLVEARERLAELDKKCQEHASSKPNCAEKFSSAKAEYEAAKEKVQKAIDEEEAVARKKFELNNKITENTKALNEHKQQLLEMQQRVMKLQAHASIMAQFEAVQERRRLAAAAAEEAKRALKETKELFASQRSSRKRQSVAPASTEPEAKKVSKDDDVTAEVSADAQPVVEAQQEVVEAQQPVVEAQQPVVDTQSISTETVDASHLDVD